MKKNNLSFLQADAETMILIGEKIIQRHTALGPKSPLSNAVIADLNFRISSAKLKHEEAMKLKRMMEDAIKDRDHYMGSNDKGVVYTLMAISNILEEGNVHMDDWGL
jgi:hypothetical protein